MITLKRSINGLISVIIFKRTMSYISFNFTYLQDNYLGTYVSMNTFMTGTQMVAVLTYLCTLCFLLRASDWSFNVQRRKCRTLPFTRNCPVTSAPWVWGRFSCFCSHLDLVIFVDLQTCSKLNYLKKNFQKHYYNKKLKKSGSRSGPMICQSWSGIGLISAGNESRC